MARRKSSLAIGLKGAIPINKGCVDDEAFHTPGTQRNPGKQTSNFPHFKALSDYNFPIQIGAIEYVKVHSFFAVKLNDLTTVFKVRRKKSSANSVTFAEDTRREDSSTGERDKKGHLSHST